MKMRLKVQLTDVHRKLEKDVVTLLVISIFSGFLGNSRNCIIIVFPMLGFRVYAG